MSDNYLINTADRIYNDNLNNIIMKKLYENNILTKEDFEQTRLNTIKNIEALKNVMKKQNNDKFQTTENDMKIFDHLVNIVNDIHNENLNIL